MLVFSYLIEGFLARAVYEENATEDKILISTMILKQRKADFSRMVMTFRWRRSDLQLIFEDGLYGSEFKETHFHMVRFH